MNRLLLLGIVIVFLAVLMFPRFPTKTGNYYSLTERRMPCGRILRREVVHENDAWRKTVTLLDPSGRVLDSKTRTIEPEHCSAIQAGRFVPGLWRDCYIPF